MTYRERRIAKAERLQEWAEKREKAAEAVFKAGEPFRGDIAFNTQPGHIPFRARLIAREDRAYQSLQKAHNMESRAAGILDQADRAIYSDDPDAIKQLAERIAKLEAERDHKKAINKAYRAGDTAFAAATGVTLEQAALARERIEAGYSWQRKPYDLTLLSSNIKRQRDRLARLQEQHGS